MPVAKISGKQSAHYYGCKNPNLIATVLDDFSGGELDKVIGDFGKKGITIPSCEKTLGMLGGGGEYKYNGKTYTFKGASRR